MKRLYPFCLSLLFVMLTGYQTNASVTAYDNRSAYLAASNGLGTATSIDFSTKDDNTPITNPAADEYIDLLVLRGVTFNARSYYNLAIYNFPEPWFTTANLPQNTYAFGIDLFRGSDATGTFTITLSSGESFQVASGAEDVYFFGAVSSNPIQWAKFSFNNDYIVLDNFTYTRNTPYEIPDGDVNGLIAAINGANARPGPDAINLAPGGTYTLTQPADNIDYAGLPRITSEITINGNGSVIQRSSSPGTPIFRIMVGLYANLTLDRITIKGGHAPSEGGGIFNNRSQITLRNSTVTENTATDGGGIVNLCGTLVIENSTISYNTGFGGRTGGGIFNWTFSCSSSTVSISNSTIYENQAGGSPGFEGRGDAIADAFSPLGSVVIKNSIIASPTRGLGADCGFFTPNSLGHNIFSDNSCGQNVAGSDLIVSNFTLGALALNGGSTPTHALFAGSPAINAIPPDDCTTISGVPVSTDQRGVLRPFGTGCDIGAYEFENTDSSPPVISPLVSGTLGIDGWYTGDITVSWSVADPDSAVSSLTGCDTSSVTTDTSGATFTCSATSSGGTATQSVTVKRDATAPAVSCSSADGAWHSLDVSIACTAADNFSGLAAVADANFSLTTNVIAGTETNNASTGSRQVCDLAGNCGTANSVSGNKIDKKAPVIAVAAPIAAGSFLLNQSVAVSYTCTDGGSGVANCTGTTATGGLLNTGSAGAKTFTVSSTDNVGNAAAPAVVNYTVNFALTLLFDQTRAHRSGSTVPIKIRLVDANGANVSLASTIVHAISVIQTSSQASTNMDDAGNSNPDFDFRYDATLGGYIYNLQTTGYGTGSYILNFISGNSPTVYSVDFQVRQ